LAFALAIHTLTNTYTKARKFLKEPIQQGEKGFSKDPYSKEKKVLARNKDQKK